MINYQRLYEYRFRNVDQTRRELVWSAIAPAICEWLGHPERMLDPAAGRCEFLNAAPAPERWGIDAVKYEEALPDEGVRLLVSDVMQVDLPHAYFDGIFVSNFLEHLQDADEVAAFLDKMRDCACPGGRIAVMGPNFRYCAREYFDFADHRVILTEESATEHLYAAGFKIKKIFPRFLPYSFGGRLPTHPTLVHGYLRARFAWPLLGKQFLIIAERPPAPHHERDGIY
jgi:SAM-dependent methyltransferase